MARVGAFTKSCVLAGLAGVWACACAAREGARSEAPSPVSSPASMIGVSADTPAPSPGPSPGPGAGPGPGPGSSSAPAPTAQPRVVYEPPPPITIRRSFVYSLMEGRNRDTVTVVSLLSTSEDDAALAVGAEVELQRKPEQPAGSDADWAPLATAVVEKIETQGSRLKGNERQLIRLRITREYPGTTLKGRASPFRRGAKARLQVDRRGP